MFVENVDAALAAATLMFSPGDKTDATGTIYRTERGCGREVNRIANSDWLI